MAVEYKLYNKSMEFCPKLWLFLYTTLAKNKQLPVFSQFPDASVQLQTPLYTILAKNKVPAQLSVFSQSLVPGQAPYPPLHNPGQEPGPQAGAILLPVYGH